MARNRSSDIPLVVASLVALLVMGGVIYGAVDAATQDATFDTNSPNATTQGPPASFEKR
ncbi:MAG: hypothetical protein LC789_06475 [Actinobacteria bacterium]|nr:hypothetical protein [Actinomycetota bacterium]MCA1720432.1 hypothetical protein [Actinomycetota bacterium]